MTEYSARDLSALNTLGVTARAQHFAQVDSIAEVQKACQWARQRDLAVHVLGGGSNIVTASHVAGLVIQPAIGGIRPLQADQDHQWVEVGAGENWHQLVGHCLAAGWYGLENLSLIPGTAGAAPIQNIGAYGVELSHVFDSLDAVHVGTGRLEHFTLNECEFGYRDSVFKSRLHGSYVITHVRLKLMLKPRLKLSYPALAQAVADLPSEQLTPQRVADTVCRLRCDKLPDPAEIPNCGSFFKNPHVTRVQYERILAQFPDVVAFPGSDQNSAIKLAAGWLIEKAGWKGRECQGVRVHPQQALVLTNPGRVSAEHLMAVAAQIVTDVEQLFGVKLEQEPQIIR